MEKSKNDSRNSAKFRLTFNTSTSPIKYVHTNSSHLGGQVHNATFYQEGFVSLVRWPMSNDAKMMVKKELHERKEF